MQVFLLIVGRIAKNDTLIRKKMNSGASYAPKMEERETGIQCRDNKRTTQRDVDTTTLRKRAAYEYAAHRRY